MLFILGILAAITLLVLIHIFTSQNSTQGMKKAAMIALILSGLAAGICGIIIFIGHGSAEQDVYAWPLPVENAEPPPKSESSSFGLIAFLALLIGFFVFIIYVALKEKRKHH